MSPKEAHQLRISQATKSIPSKLLDLEAHGVALFNTVIVFGIFRKMLSHAIISHIILHHFTQCRDGFGGKFLQKKMPGGISEL